MSRGRGARRAARLEAGVSAAAASRWPVVHRVAGVAVTAFVVSCGPPDAPDGTEFEDRDSGVAADIDVADIGRPGEAVVVDDMAGTWLHFQQVSTCVDFGDIHFEQYTRYLYVVEIEQDARGMIRETWQACNIELTPTLGLQPTVNPPVLETSFPVSTGGHAVYGTEIGAEYHSGPVPEIWGVDFEEPLLEPFPADRDDDRIYDSDLDGNPGVTLIFGDDICRAYMANRTINNHHGVYVAPDRIEGYVTSNTQQRVLGATAEICGREYVTRDNQPRNRFARQRVDGRGHALDLRNEDGAVTCESARATYLDIFERTPADDSSCAL